MCDTEYILSAECEMKVAQCGVINSVIEGGLGPMITNIGLCAKFYGVAFLPNFFAALGKIVIFNLIRKIKTKRQLFKNISIFQRESSLHFQDSV